MALIEGLVLTAGGVTIASLGAQFRSRRSHLLLCAQAAREAGLEDIAVRSPGGWPLRVEGRRGGLKVAVSSRYNFYSGRMATRVVIRGVTRRLSIRASSAAAFAARRSALTTGDRTFDVAVLVTGDAAVAAALLDAPARDRIRELFAERASFLRKDLAFERGVRLDPGWLVGERVSGDQPEWIAAFLRDLVALAERLQEPEDLAPRLATNLRDEPNPGVRRSNLRVLLDAYPDHQATHAALRLGLEDADEDLRLASALAIGAEGRAALLAIASSETALEAAAARAVAELRSALPVGTARDILARALRARHLRTAEACLDSLSRRGPEQADAIGRVLEVERGPFAVAAARALGRVGAAPAVVLLREAEARAPRDGELRRVARDAIAAIHGRLSGADEGQVTLSDGDAGHLSLARDEAGRVSLPAPEPKPSGEP